MKVAETAEVRAAALQALLDNAEPMTIAQASEATGMFTVGRIRTAFEWLVYQRVVERIAVFPNQFKAVPGAARVVQRTQSNGQPFMDIEFAGKPFGDAVPARWNRETAMRSEGDLILDSARTNCPCCVWDLGSRDSNLSTGGTT